MTDNLLKEKNPSRMSLKRRATLLKICFAAFVELGETDLEGLAIRKVMAEADYAFNTFYNYFGNRETLMASIMDEIVFPWRQQFLECQGPLEDEAVKLGYLTRAWIREFARDTHFARFALRNGAFIHKADAKSNRDALDYFKSGAEKGLFVLSPVESKYIAVGLFTTSAALILREQADASLAETIAWRQLVMLGVDEKRAHEIAHMPLVESESLDFVFQRRLEDACSRI